MQYIPNFGNIPFFIWAMLLTLCSNKISFVTRINLYLASSRLWTDWYKTVVDVDVVVRCVDCLAALWVSSQGGVLVGSARVRNRPEVLLQDGFWPSWQTSSCGKYQTLPFTWGLLFLYILPPFQWCYPWKILGVKCWILLLTPWAEGTRFSYLHFFLFNYILAP